MKSVFFAAILAFVATANAEELVAWHATRTVNLSTGASEAHVQISKVESGTAAAAALAERGFHLEPNVKFHTMTVAVESAGPTPVPLAASWVAEAMHVPQAHQLPNAKGDGAQVCVVDTGVDANHTLLRGKIREAISLIPNEDANDGLGHGTHVASLIAGDAQMGAAAPRAKIISVKVFSASGNAGGDLATISKGIQTCISRKADVINLSLGTTTPTPLLQTLIRQAVGQGTVVVAAAGNSANDVSYPAAYPEAIAAGATNQDLSIAEFSARKPYVKLVAPGVKIQGAKAGGGYVSLSGTSMAAALVSGVAAVAKSRHASGVKAYDLGLKPEEQGAGMADALATAEAGN